MTDFLLIAGMALVTYAIRSAAFVLGHRLRFAPRVQMALGFVPVTVLTAIIVPMTISPHGGGAEWTWRNAQLIAALVAVTVSVVTKKPLLTIAASLSFFFLWQLIAKA